MLVMCKHRFCNVRWCIANHFLCSCVCDMDHESAINYHYYYYNTHYRVCFLRETLPHRNCWISDPSFTLFSSRVKVSLFLLLCVVVPLLYITTSTKFYNNCPSQFSNFLTELKTIMQRFDDFCLNT